MQDKKLELLMFSTLIAGLSVLTFFVFKPFLHIIVLAMVLSVLFYPLYKKIVDIFWGNKTFSASLLLAFALFFLIIPILFLGLQISGQAQNFFSLAQADQSQYIQSIQFSINNFVQQIIPTFSFNVSDLINNILTFISSNFGGLLSQTTYLFFQTFLLLFTFFFFLRDGEKMLSSLISLSPFEKSQNKEILSSIDRTITSVIRGTLFVGLIRFVLVSSSFYFIGIPDAILWGSIAGIIGAVPGIGTPIVIIPACIYLLLYGNLASVIILIVLGILITFFIDNLLVAYFFGKGLDVPSIFVLFSILGGIIFFGPLGFIFGPIVLSLFVSLVDMYKILIQKKS